MTLSLTETGPFKSKQRLAWIQRVFVYLGGSADAAGAST